MTVRPMKMSMKKTNDPDGPLHKWGEPEGVEDYKNKTPGQGKMKSFKEIQQESNLDLKINGKDYDTRMRDNWKNIHKIAGDLQREKEKKAREAEAKHNAEEANMNEGKTDKALMARVKGLKGKQGVMARFLASQGNTKELNKFLAKVEEGYGKKSMKEEGCPCCDGGECKCKSGCESCDCSGQIDELKGSTVNEVKKPFSSDYTKKAAVPHTVAFRNGEKTTIMARSKSEALKKARQQGEHKGKKVEYAAASESVEQVDEADLRKMDHDKFMKYGDSNPKGRADPTWNAERKRRYKNSQASMYRKMKKEEVEQIDEIGDTPKGKKVLGAYVKKAAGSMAAKQSLAKTFKNDGYPHLKKMNRHSPNNIQFNKKGEQKKTDPKKFKAAKKDYETTNNLSKDFSSGADRRRQGIGRAVDRLTKEGFQGQRVSFTAETSVRGETGWTKTDDKPKQKSYKYDGGWKPASAQRKDERGNTIKNVAKHLAKKGLAKVSSEGLSPKQEKHLDVHDDGKIDHKDFAKLRKNKKNN